MRQAQANEQIILLGTRKLVGNADFFSYRYLATEGFLPGYNFPPLATLRVHSLRRIPRRQGGLSCNAHAFSPSRNLALAA